MEPKKTRSGRLVKPPERYVPIEKVEDDYSSDEYDSDDSDNDEVPSSVCSSSDEEDDDDSEGSLKDFIVPDEDSESDSDS
jgi:hypothetical protein